jgi:hypothetical protein
LAVGATGVRAETIDVLISLTTGDISLRNPNASSFDIVGYSLATNPGTLNNAAWTSITETYDAPVAPTPGNGLVDPDGSWLKLSAPGSTSDLSEGVFTGDGGSLTAGQIVSLGPVWNTSVAPDAAIEVEVAQPLGMATVNVLYRHNSDYNNDLIVNDWDLYTWAANRGLGTLPSEGDGDRDGDVDGDDLLLWQREVGLVGLTVLGAGAGAGSSLLSVATVPEPATLCLLIVGGVGCLLAMRGRGPLR